MPVHEPDCGSPDGTRRRVLRVARAAVTLALPAPHGRRRATARRLVHGL